MYLMEETDTPNVHLHKLHEHLYSKWWLGCLIFHILCIAWRTPVSQMATTSWEIPQMTCFFEVSDKAQYLEVSDKFQ